jgi:hypothetical protein
MPLFVKNKFGEDLLAGESIPEKYKVSIDDVIKRLKKAGFKIEKVGHGHLFFFIFGWLDRFVPFSKVPFVPNLYKALIRCEEFLLKFKTFQDKTEVFSIRAIKK